MVETSVSRLRKAGGSIYRKPVSFREEKRRRRAKKAGTFKGRTSEDVVTANEQKVIASTKTRTSTGTTTSKAQLRQATPTSTGEALRNQALRKKTSTVKQSTRDRILARHAASPRGTFEPPKHPDVERLPFEVRKEASRERKRKSMTFSQVTIKAPRPFLDEQQAISREQFIKETSKPFVEKEQKRRAIDTKPSTAIEKVIPGLKVKSSDKPLTAGAKGFISGTAEGAAVGAALGAGGFSTSVVSGGTVGAVGTSAGTGAILTGAAVGAVAVGTGIATVKATRLNIESGKAGIEGFKEGGLKGAVDALGKIGKARRATIKEFAKENAETIGRVSGTIIGGITGDISGKKFVTEEALASAKFASKEPSVSTRVGSKLSPKTKTTSVTELKAGGRRLTIKATSKGEEQVFTKQGFVTRQGKETFNVFEGGKKIGTSEGTSEGFTTLGDKQKFGSFSKITTKGKTTAITTKGTATKVYETAVTGKTGTRIVKGGVATTQDTGVAAFRFKSASYVTKNGKVSKDPFFGTTGVSVKTTGTETITTPTKGFGSKTTVNEKFLGEVAGGSIKKQPIDLKREVTKIGKGLKKVVSSNKAQFAISRGERLVPTFGREISRVVPSTPSVSLARPVVQDPKLFASSFEVGKDVFRLGGIIPSIAIGTSLGGVFGVTTPKAPSVSKIVTGTVAKPSAPAQVITQVTAVPKTEVPSSVITVPEVGVPSVNRIVTGGGTTINNFVGDPFVPRPPAPIEELPFFFPPLGGGLGFVGGSRKRRAKSRRAFKFTPSLVAIEKEIRGAKPARLTGFEVRPLKVRR